MGMGQRSHILGDLYQKRMWTLCLVSCHCHTHCRQQYKVRFDERVMRKYDGYD